MLPQRRAQSYRGLSSIASKMHQSIVFCFEAKLSLLRILLNLAQVIYILHTETSPCNKMSVNATFTMLHGGS